MKENVFARDLLASVVVFLVALPLCMGVAVASGVPPALGLIAGIVGGLVIGWASGSLTVSGPTVSLAAIVWQLTQTHGIAVLGPVVMLAGVLQVVAGSLKLGQYFRAVAPPVVYGMLAGIGALIFGSQFHVMVDDTPKGSGIQNFLGIPLAIYKGIVPAEGTAHHWAAIVGLATIGSILLWIKFRPARLSLVPPALVAVVASTAFAFVAGLPVKHIDVPANLFAAINWPTIDSLRRLFDVQVLGTAFALALISSAETLLSATAVDRMHSGPRTEFDRELRSQGIGNLICGAFGALPVAGVIVRSSVNVQAGARTWRSTVLHGLWVMAFAVTFPGLLRMIPTAALAALLVYTGFKLVNIDNIRDLAKYGRAPVAIYLATLIGIVATDLLTGVLIGVAGSVARLIYLLTHAEIELACDAAEKRADLSLRGSLTFLALPRLARHLDMIPAGTDLHVHIPQLQHIDHACMDALHTWQARHESLGSKLYMEWDSLVQKHHRVRTDRPREDARGQSQSAA